MKEVVDRVLFLHVSLPGQHPEDEELHCFPSIQDLAINMVTVLDTLGITDRGVVVMGEGAGANIAARFAMYYPNRVYGAVLINFHNSRTIQNKDKRNQINKNSCALNMTNVKMYEDSYKTRGDITLTPLTRKTLLLLGDRSSSAEECQDILCQVKRGICSVIRIAGVGDVIEEAPEQTGDALILFCQELGLLPLIQRRVCQAVEEKRQEL